MRHTIIARNWSKIDFKPNPPHPHHLWCWKIRQVRLFRRAEVGRRRQRILLRSQRILIRSLSDLEQLTSGKLWHFRAGMRNSVFWRAKKMLPRHSRARLFKFFLNFYSVSSKNQSKNTYIWAMRARLKAFAGQIWPAGCMLCMPALEVGVATMSPNGTWGLKSVKKLKLI